MFVTSGHHPLPLFSSRLRINSLGFCDSGDSLRTGLRRRAVRYTLHTELPPRYHLLMTFPILSILQTVMLSRSEVPIEHAISITKTTETVAFEPAKLFWFYPFIYESVCLGLDYLSPLLQNIRKTFIYCNILALSRRNLSTDNIELRMKCCRIRLCLKSVHWQRVIWPFWRELHPNTLLRLMSSARKSLEILKESWNPSEKSLHTSYGFLAMMTLISTSYYRPKFALYWTQIFKRMGSERGCEAEWWYRCENHGAGGALSVHKLWIRSHINLRKEKHPYVWHGGSKSFKTWCFLAIDFRGNEAAEIRYTNWISHGKTKTMSFFF